MHLLPTQHFFRRKRDLPLLARAGRNFTFHQTWIRDSPSWMNESRTDLKTINESRTDLKTMNESRTNLKNERKSHQSEIFGMG